MNISGFQVYRNSREPEAGTYSWGTNPAPAKFQKNRTEITVRFFVISRALGMESLFVNM